MAPPIAPPLPAGTPPLLLTKRLMSFLHSNLTSSLTTIFLTSPSGKLLSHATIDPACTVTALRTRATVAALLYNIHNAGSVAAADATKPDHDDGNGRMSRMAGYESAGSEAEAPGAPANGAAASATRGAQKAPEQRRRPTTITLQLTHHVIVVRRLACNVLFVALGPLLQGAGPGPSRPPSHVPSLSTSPSGPAGSTVVTAPMHTLAQTPIHTAAADTARSDLSLAAVGREHDATSLPSTEATAVVDAPFSAATNPTPHLHPHPHHGQSLTVGSPSESILSAGASSVTSAGVAGAVSLRRHAEEVAVKLDAKLAALSVPGEGIGVEYFG